MADELEDDSRIDAPSCDKHIVHHSDCWACLSALAGTVKRNEPEKPIKDKRDD